LVDYQLSGRTGLGRIAGASLYTRQALAVSLLGLAAAGAGSPAGAQNRADPAAAEMYVLPGTGKYKIPVGDCAQPVWPREALRYELEGVATIRYTLLPDGRVSEPEVARSSGWAILDDATMALLMTCKYTLQQAAEVQGRVLPLQFVWRLEGQRVRAGIVPGTCVRTDKFFGFIPFDRRPSDEKGVKVRFLIDKAGQPRGIKFEAADIDPETASRVVGYVDSCRFAFDPNEQGEHTDTMFGRVLLR
jgi:TonB family protein